MQLEFRKKIEKFLEQANRVILGKDEEVCLILCCLLSRGHLLIEDRPGMGKTTMVKLLARLTGLKLSRIQFTNDLLPADIVGNSIYDQEFRKFVFHKGPIFSEVVLGDELNRATPKTQSACLQAMEEHEVTVDGQTHSLPNPFFFIATQNPTQNIGTFPLPESQLDRFLMRIRMGFPPRAAERLLIMGPARQMLIDELEPAITPVDLIAMQEKARAVHLSDAIVDYMQDLIERSRQKADGLSPRAGLGLAAAAKSWALLQGRDYVIPEDVQTIAVPVMGHRLGNTNLPGQGEKTAQEILKNVAVA